MFEVLLSNVGEFFRELSFQKKTFCVHVPGRVAQSIACLTSDPGVAISIPARSHTFVETDHEIISTAILLL